MEKVIIDMCGLCLEESELRKSHIIPSWIHLKISKTEGKGTYIVDGEKIQSNKQLGYIKEPLLCDNCEKSFAEWENYIKNYMSPTKGHNFKKLGSNISIHSLEEYIFNNVDPYKLWFFFTSILYRMSIAKSILYKNMKMNGYNLANLKSILNNQSNNVGNFIVFGAYKKIKCFPDTDGVSPLGAMNYKVISSDSRIGPVNPVWVLDIAGWVFYIEELSSPESTPTQKSIINFESKTFKINFYSFMDKIVLVNEEDRFKVVTCLPTISEYNEMNLKKLKEKILSSTFERCPCDNPDVRLKKECCSLYFNIK